LDLAVHRVRVVRVRFVGQQPFTVWLEAADEDAVAVTARLRGSSAELTPTIPRLMNSS